MFTTVHYHNPASSFTRKQKLFFFFFFKDCGWGGMGLVKSNIKQVHHKNYCNIKCKKNYILFVYQALQYVITEKKIQSQIEHQVKLTPDS